MGGRYNNSDFSLLGRKIGAAHGAVISYSFCKNKEGYIMISDYINSGKHKTVVLSSGNSPPHRRSAKSRRSLFRQSDEF